MDGVPLRYGHQTLSRFEEIVDACNALASRLEAGQQGTVGCIRCLI